MLKPTFSRPIWILLYNVVLAMTRTVSENQSLGSFTSGLQNFNTALDAKRFADLLNARRKLFNDNINTSNVSADNKLDVASVPRSVNITFAAMNHQRHRNQRFNRTTANRNTQNSKKQNSNKSSINTRRIKRRIDKLRYRRQNWQTTSSTQNRQQKLGEQDPKLCPPKIGGNLERFEEINWFEVDRRCEENWWHLYPFGERYYDTDYGMENFRLWHDKQIDLDFFIPFYGFRYNYTFIYPEGFIAFSYPRYVQPPYEFPTQRWPVHPDPSIIAAFLTPQSFMFVGNIPISHVWYRVVARPNKLINPDSNGNAFDSGTGEEEILHRLKNGLPSRRVYKNHRLKMQEGRVEDPVFLDRISRDISEGMVGARGFIANYALIVTWERMGYGGAPKYNNPHMYDEVKRWVKYVLYS